MSDALHPDTGTDRNLMPEMLQYFVNVGAKGQMKYKQNHRTIKIKKPAELDAVSLKGLICLQRGAVGCGREGSESENKSKTNLRSGTQRAATQEGLMRSRGL